MFVFGGGVECNYYFSIVSHLGGPCVSKKVEYNFVKEIYFKKIMKIFCFQGKF